MQRCDAFLQELELLRERQVVLIGRGVIRHHGVGISQGGTSNQHGIGIDETTNSVCIAPMILVPASK